MKAQDSATAAKTDADRAKTEADRAASEASDAAVVAVTDRVNTLLEGAPEAYDTLAEIATKLSNQDDVATALTAQIGQKVDKVSTTSRVYGTSSSGQQTTYQLGGTNTSAGTIPLRRPGGTVGVGTPTADDDAATKAYVDGAISNFKSYEVVNSIPSAPVPGTLYVILR